jgi:hypothetical protein
MLRASYLSINTDPGLTFIALGGFDLLLTSHLLPIYIYFYLGFENDSDFKQL